MITVIISDTSDLYERVYTRNTRSMFLLKLKYQLKGYRVWAFPTVWMARICYNLTGKRIYRGVNMQFEKHIPGSDQITHWEPWML